MKQLKYLILLSAFISLSSVAGGFRQISIGSGQLPEQVQSQALNYVPRNPVTVSGQLTVPNGQTINELRLTVDVDGHSPEVTSLSVSYGPGSHNFTISSGAVAAGNASISIKALSGSTVLFSNTYGQSASIPDQIGTLLNNPNLITSNLDITSSDLIGVLNSSNQIDSDILSNIADLNAEIDENDHGCSVPGTSATGTQGRAYLICVMEAHYADVAAGALAAFSSTTPTQLTSCSGDLCGPAPSICSELIWTCHPSSSNLPSTGSLDVGLNGPTNTPVDIGGIDVTQSLTGTSYEVELRITGGYSPIPVTSFSYTNLSYPADVYSAPNALSSSLATVEASPLVNMNTPTSTGFSYRNAQNSLTYTLTNSDGTALPTNFWASIDSTTGVVTGVPTSVNDDTTLRVTATDTQGASAFVELPINVTNNISDAALAQYELPQARSNNRTLQLNTWPISDSIGFAGKNSNLPNGLIGNLYVNGSNSTTSSGIGNRLSFNALRDALDLGDYSEGSYNINGLRDSDNELVTIATSSNEYLVVGIAERDASQARYRHGVLQLIPTPRRSTSLPSSSDSADIFLASKPYGFLPDTMNDGVGDILIAGNIAVGQTLTADLTQFSDPDGYTTGGSTDKSNISLQWLENGIAIPGATGSSYAIPPSKEGSTISLRATYTDSAFRTEVHTSASTVAVATGTLPNTFIPPIAALATDSGSYASITATDIDDLQYSDDDVARIMREEVSTLQSGLATSHGCTAITANSNIVDVREFAKCVVQSQFTAQAVRDANSIPSFNQLPGTSSCDTNITGPAPSLCAQDRWDCTLTAGGDNWTYTDNNSVNDRPVYTGTRDGNPINATYTITAAPILYYPLTQDFVYRNLRLRGNERFNTLPTRTVTLNSTQTGSTEYPGYYCLTNHHRLATKAEISGRRATNDSRDLWIVHKSDSRMQNPPPRSCLLARNDGVRTYYGICNGSYDTSCDDLTVSENMMDNYGIMRWRLADGSFTDRCEDGQRDDSTNGNNNQIKYACVDISYAACP